MLDDDSVMPIGNAYRGKRMRDVPDGYLKWLWDANKDTLSETNPITYDVLMYAKDRLN